MSPLCGSFSCSAQQDHHVASECTVIFEMVRSPATKAMERDIGARMDGLPLSALITIKMGCVRLHTPGRSTHMLPARTWSARLINQLFQLRTINAEIPQREHVRHFLPGPLCCTAHFVKTPLVSARIPRVELGCYEHAVAHSVAFAIIHALKGHSPMGVGDTTFHLNPRIETTTGLLG